VSVKPVKVKREGALFLPSLVTAVLGRGAVDNSIAMGKVLRQIEKANLILWEEGRERR